MRKSLLAVVAVITLAGAADAATGNYTSAGCGVGSIIFEGKKGKTQLVLAATTNGVLSNTFGISSETLGCTSDGVVKADKRLEMYAEANYERLSREAAQGGGEYLAALGSLLGVKDRKAFFTLTQARHDALFPAKGDASFLLRSLKAELARS